MFFAVLLWALSIRLARQDVLSVTAYSLLTHRGVASLFQFIIAGFFLLSLGLLSGLMFVEDFFAQRKDSAICKGGKSCIAAR